MRAITLLIKPASSACMLRCEYCFYRDVADHRENFFQGMMTQETLETLVRNAFASAEEYCGFAFQGGEPTLAGLDFFRNVVKLQARYNTKNIMVQNSLQTNGMTLDDDWAEFLGRNRFLVGLSLDGPNAVHNRRRVDSQGKGTHSRVMAATRLLRRHNVDFNILTVITRETARHIASIYRFLTREGFGYLQFIPVLDPLDAPAATDWSLDAEESGEYLIRVFDLWFADLQKGRYTSVRHIDNWLSILLGQQPEACNMTGRCSVQFVVEGDGGVYPCDFYVTDDWRLGTVASPFAELAATATADRFVRESLPRPANCDACRWFLLCRNGCKRERERDPNAPALNRYCAAYTTFFEQRIEQLRAACALLGKRSV